MFSSSERSQLRADLLKFAADDSRITGAAVTGSAADSREDQWSDVDLAFGVSTAAYIQLVLSDWTSHLYDRHRAVHHVDIVAGAWTYRVFLLSNTLQVDLAFVAETEFRALAPTFKLMFGDASEARYAPPPQADATIGMAWLYALHARSSVARRKRWQAVHMISGVRDNALALACIRNGLPAVHGRGVDLLPNELATAFEESLVRSLDLVEIRRAFQVITHLLVDEIRRTDEALAGRLQEVLTMMSEISP